MLDPQDPSVEIASKAAANLITEVFKSAGRGVKRFDKWVGDKAVERDMLGLAARQYAQRLEDRYNTMRVLGMSEPVPLKDIYVRVNVLEKIQERLHRSLEDLEKHFQRDRRRFGTVIETKAGIDIVGKKRRLMVLGKPGAGKTTFLKHLIFQALEGKLPGKYVPIFVSLKDWSDEGSDLLEYITEEFDRCNLPEAKPWIEHLLYKGKCLLLLDGLDEITENADDAIRKIRDFSDKYDRNRFVISCRIAAYSYVFERFTDVEMADFDDEQIEAFIKNWFRHDEKTAALCWERMCADPPTKELGSAPLLLVLLCLAFDETLSFPSNRAELYQEAIDALLKKWDASRRIKRSEIYKGLTLRRKVDLLSIIAYHTFSKGQYFIPQRMIKQHIADYIANFPEVTDVSLMPDSEAILRAIEAQHGLLIKRAKRVYSFSHLTVQEYFTARYIVATKVEGAVRRLIEEHSPDRNWKEVIELTASMLMDATPLVGLLRKTIRKRLGKVVEEKARIFIEAHWRELRHLLKADIKINDDINLSASYIANLHNLRHHISVLILDHDQSKRKGIEDPVQEAQVKAIYETPDLLLLLSACLQPHCFVAKETRKAILASELRDL